jgi:pyruvate-formate lyase
LLFHVSLLQAYGYELPKDIEYIYNNVRKTHNSGVFDAYTDEMKRARKSGILTGLPDGYGKQGPATACAAVYCKHFSCKQFLQAKMSALGRGTWQTDETVRCKRTDHVGGRYREGD